MPIGNFTKGNTVSEELPSRELVLIPEEEKAEGQEDDLEEIKSYLSRCELWLVSFY